MRLYAAIFCEGKKNKKTTIQMSEARVEANIMN